MQVLCSFNLEWKCHSSKHTARDTINDFKVLLDIPNGVRNSALTSVMQSSKDIFISVQVIPAFHN